MATSFTPFANLAKPEVGNGRNTWGTDLNNTIDTIDAKFSSQNTDILARLRLDGAVPMQGSITFVNNDQGIKLSAGTRMIDDIGGSGQSICYLDATNSHFMVRTADGTSALLDVSLAALTYKGEKLLQPSDAGTYFLPLTGGTLTDSLTVPIINVEKVGHSDNLWVDYVNGAGHAVLQFAPGLAYVADRQAYTHNWITKSGDLQSDMDGMTLQPGGNLVIAGDFTKDSDLRLKDNVQSLNNALALLSQLRPVSFNYKADGKYNLGFIAQEVEAIPALAHAVFDGPKGTKTVAYMQLIAPMIQAINELAAKVAELEARSHG